MTCQFGNAVISVGPNSLPSDYDQIYPNFRLDSGSYNAYPFDKYSAEATAWCYYDATAVNALVSNKYEYFLFPLGIRIILKIMLFSCFSCTLMTILTKKSI